MKIGKVVLGDCTQQIPQFGCRMLFSLLCDTYAGGSIITLQWCSFEGVPLKVTTKHQ